MIISQKNIKSDCRFKPVSKFHYAYYILLMLLCLNMLSASQSIINAAFFGDISKANKLIKDGVNINAKDDIGGKSALMYASQQGHIEVIELLIEAGADVNMKNDYAKCALAYAKLNNQIKAMQIIKKYTKK